MTSQYQLGNIRFSYDKERLLDISQQSIEAHKITALVGSNGAGKSTLLRLLALLVPPATGKLVFSGVEVDKNRARALRKRIGLVQQNPYLLEGSVAKNIGLGLKLHGVPRSERANRVQEMLALLKLENLAERSAKALSGGEAQKVAIGRALILEPEVLLLDEPFTHLDRKFVEEFEILIGDLKNRHQKTIVFTTHNQLQAQMLADKILSLMNGELIESTLSNLFHGHVDPANNVFNTGKLEIYIPEGFDGCKHLAIEPERIILSKEVLKSSMRNSFPGVVTGMFVENGKVRITVDCGEQFYVYISKDALNDLSLHIHDEVVTSFKSTSIKLF